MYHHRFFPLLLVLIAPKVSVAVDADSMLLNCTTVASVAHIHDLTKGTVKTFQQELSKRSRKIRIVNRRLFDEEFPENSLGLLCDEWTRDDIYCRGWEVLRNEAEYFFIHLDRNNGEVWFIRTHYEGKDQTIKSSRGRHRDKEYEDTLKCEKVTANKF